MEPAQAPLKIHPSFNHQQSKLKPKLPNSSREAAECESPARKCRVSLEESCEPRRDGMPANPTHRSLPEMPPRSADTRRQNPPPDAVPESTPSRPPGSIPSSTKPPAPSSAPGGLPPRNG